LESNENKCFVIDDVETGFVLGSDDIFWRRIKVLMDRYDARKGHTRVLLLAAYGFPHAKVSSNISTPIEFSTSFGYSDLKCSIEELDEIRRGYENTKEALTLKLSDDYWEKIFYLSGGHMGLILHSIRFTVQSLLPSGANGKSPSEDDILFYIDSQAVVRAIAGVSRAIPSFDSPHERRFFEKILMNPSRSIETPATKKKKKNGNILPSY